MRGARGLLPLAAMLAAAAPPPPTDARDDAREVMRVVVSVETADYAGSAYRPLPCVQARLGQPSLSGGGRRNPGHDLMFGWRGLDNGRGLAPYQRILPAGDREAIREAIRAAISASRQRRWLTRIEPDWVAATLGFCAGGEYRRLEFGSPVIVGDVAFVSVDFLCPQCGHGDGIALRRNARGWAIVARRNVYMS